MKEVVVMKQNNRNMISLILMAVGVLFILVAGCIFVTTAWKYLPELGKQALLFLVAAGLYAGSEWISRCTSLRKTETALFYLGTAFIGFFLLSVMGGVGYGRDTIQADAFKILAANVVMCIAVVIRLIRRKKGFDFTIFVLLMDGILISACVAWKVRLDCFTLMLSGYVLVLSVIDSIRKRDKREREGLDISIGISYLVHGIIYVQLAGALNLFVDDLFVGFPFFFVLAMALATGITYHGRRKVVYRVLNSLALNWLVYVLFDTLNEVLLWSDRSAPVFFAAFSANLLLMVCTLRKEMMITQFSFGLLVPFAQLVFFLLKAWNWNMFEGCSLDTSVKCSYEPFSFVLAAGILMLLLREMLEKRITWENQGKKLAAAAGLQTVLGVLLWITAKHVILLEMVFHGTIAITFVLIGIWLKPKTVRSVFYTFALFAGEMAAINQPFFPIPNQYVVEWNSLIFAIGIVLLGMVWYHKKNGIAVVQFVLTCCVLAALLSKDVVSGSTGLGNVLILGGVSVVILIAAAIRNCKEYVIASSAVLLLLILYLTKDFWLSIAWWVYLFAAGVVLVLLAIKKERESK